MVSIPQKMMRWPNWKGGKFSFHFINRKRLASSLFRKQQGNFVIVIGTV